MGKWLKELVVIKEVSSESIQAGVTEKQYVPNGQSLGGLTHRGLAWLSEKVGNTDSPTASARCIGILSRTELVEKSGITLVIQVAGEN